MSRVVTYLHLLFADVKLVADGAGSLRVVPGPELGYLAVKLGHLALCDDREPAHDTQYTNIQCATVERRAATTTCTRRPDSPFIFLKPVTI